MPYLYGFWRFANAYIKVFIKRKVIERLFYLHEIREDEEVEKSLQDGTES